jgi:ATP adenylyltransferase
MVAVDLEHLWTPHRLAYIVGDAKPAGCPFCLAPTQPPEEGLVIARGELVYAILNRFPYNPGHLMVLPYRHVADYTDLTVAETAEFAAFTQQAMRAIGRASNPHGFNVGMNLGAVAGAGIAAHLHQHVVPRWAGDTNFMPIVAGTKTIPQLLVDTRDLLAAAWPDPPAAGPSTRARRGAAKTPPKTPPKKAAKSAAARAGAARNAPRKAG